MNGESVNPSLREFLEQRFEHERELTDQRFQALMDRIEQRHAMLADSLRLQAAEYERRLTSLNHAHELAVKEQARVMPREMFDVFKGEYEKFRLETSTQLQAIATRSMTWTAAIGLIVVILSALLRFWP